MAKNKKHKTIAGLAAYAQELFHKYENDCIVFMVEYIKDRRRYFECRYIYGVKSEFFTMRIMKQHTNAVLEALKIMLPKIGCNNCKLIIVSGLSSQLNSPVSISEHDVELWREVRWYVDEHYMKVKDFTDKNHEQIHSIIKDQNLFKTEIKLRMRKEQKIINQLAKHTETDNVDTVATKTIANGEGKSTMIKQADNNKKGNHSKKKTKVNRPKTDVINFKIFYSHVDAFSVRGFMKNHTNEHCLFVAGSKHDDDSDRHAAGTFDYVFTYNEIETHISGSVLSSRSSSDVMLSGILDAMRNNATANSKINIVIYTKLGFEHPTKSANKVLLQQIYQVAKDKNIELNIHLIEKGRDKIRRFIERRK